MSEARRPPITVDNIITAASVGANCPHLLAEVFGVCFLDPQLIGLLSTMSKARVIMRLPGGNHEADGWTCTPFTVTMPEVEDSATGLTENDR